MKLKIAGVIMVVAILVLGVAIYKLHTKEESAPVVIVTPAPEPVKPIPVKPVIIEVPVPICPPLVVKEAWIIKKS